MSITISDNLSGKDDINITISDEEYNISKIFNFQVISLQENDSVKENGDVEVDENGTVTVRFEEDNITVKAPSKADKDGSISHEIDFGDKESIRNL